MKTAVAIPTRTTVRRVVETIIATAALMAAIPAQAQPSHEMTGGPRVPAGAPTMKSQLPKITIAANRDTIIAGLERLELTLTREEPLDDALTVTVQLTQEQSWLANTSRNLTFAAGVAKTVLTLVAEDFSTSVVESGDLTVAVDSVEGYDTDDAAATVLVISGERPAVTVWLTHSSYLFQEDGEETDLVVTAQMAAGMPRGATVGAIVRSEDSSSAPEVTAVPGADFWPVTEAPTLREEDFERENGGWVARRNVPVTLIDDDVREGRERFRVQLYSILGSTDEFRLLNPDGTACSEDDDCLYPVLIDDDEDIPALGFSVSAEEISEEEEESSTATVSITNGKTFAADQVVTLTFAGTATDGTDYTVAPADGDDGTSGHQVIMPAGATSVDVTLTAVDDDIEDGNETIQVSATHDGEAVGSTQTIRILNQEQMPRITLAASRDTIIAGLEELEFTVTLGAPPEEDLTVTVRLTQEQPWVSRTAEELRFPAGTRIHELGLHESVFSSDVTESGTLTATVDPVSGYDTGDATRTVHVVSQEGPAITVSFGQETYRFREGEEGASVLVTVQAAPGMPRGAFTEFKVGFRSGTAESGVDFSAREQDVRVLEDQFTLVDSRWQHQLPVEFTLLDDKVSEGTEKFTLFLEEVHNSPAKLEVSDVDAVVEIMDDDGIPEMELSLSAEEIREDGETASTATVTITNGVTFATDQTLTFNLGGDAIAGHDYRVTPADADDGAGHQIVLPARAESVAVTFTAIDDEEEEGDEEIRIAATHDGNVIGDRTIRIADRRPGPGVEVTFEGVGPPEDDYDAGTATGPFVTRIRFSEQVEGFSEDDIIWSTHSGTTEDSSFINVLMWDYTEVRPGLEYTARMMPAQSGRLHVTVFREAATSVATGQGNRLGSNNLWIELPDGRMMVAPTELAVVEGGAAGEFMIVLTSKPTDTVTLSVNGMAGTNVSVEYPTVIMAPDGYWTGGWVVEATAGRDADAEDETVILQVQASGGGFDGQKVDVVVNVMDNGAAHALGMSEEEAIGLLEDVSPEEAAAALFGEGDLSEGQFAALDLLGNANGGYDLGDLVSWIARCERGEAKCGGSPSPASNSIPGAAGAMAAAGRIARNGPRRRGSARSPTRSSSRNGSPLWNVVLLLLAAITFWGCRDGDGLVNPRAAEPDPGYLTVELVAPPAARDTGAMLVVEGPGIDSVRAPGLELFQSEVSSPQQIIVAGTLATGPIAEFHVPDRTLRSHYRVGLLEVTGEDYSLRDLSEYGVAIKR